MKFLLYRILGNDMPPRHLEGQTIKNLKFILENESDFPDCRKIFYLNRIINQRVVKDLKGLIKEAGYEWIEDPFRERNYSGLRGDKQKLLYLTNVNGARNTCLDGSFTAPYHKVYGADCVLPLDGGCYFPLQGWTQFANQVSCTKNNGYFKIPMCRLPSYESATDCTISPTRMEEYHLSGGRLVVGNTEPQIAFTEYADVKYDEDTSWSDGDKIKLLCRLGIPGVWDHMYPRDILKATQERSKFFGKVKSAGFVFRLPSGNPEADKNNAIRESTRRLSLKAILKQVKE